MKILHVIPSISRAHGGPTTALETMTRALAHAGIEVDIATTDDDGAARMDVPLGEAVVREGVTHWFFRRQTQFYKFSLPLTRWLARNVARYDVVHIHALFSYATLPAAFFAARQKTPYIVRPLGTLNRVGMQHYHGALKRVSFPLLERPLIERAAFLHFTSALERDQAREIGVTQRDAMIPIGVELQDAANGACGDWLRQHAPQFLGRTVFLFLGRIDPIKGLDILLPAFARARKECAKIALIVAGAGDAGYERSLRAGCEKLGMADDVFFAGYVEGEMKRALLRDADVFVLPSRSENQGVAVVEAMAAGLPVVVTPEVGIAREIAACGAGIVVSSATELLADALVTLAGDETRRAAMAGRGKFLAAEKFSIGAMTRALMAMYEGARTA